MKKRRALIIQTIGGAMLTACLAIYVADACAFLRLRSGPGELPRGEAVVTRLWEENVSGSLRSGSPSFHVAFESSRGHGKRQGQGEVPAGLFRTLEAGSIVSVVSWRDVDLLASDVRWDPKHRRKYWLMLVAAGIFGVETVRRFCFYLRQ